MKLLSQEKVLLVNGRFLTQKQTGVQRFAYQIVSELLAQNIPLVILVPPKSLFKGYSVEGWPLMICGFGGGQFWEQISLPVFLMNQRWKRNPAILLNFCNTAPVFYKKNILALHDVAFLDKPEWFKKSFVFAYKSVMPLLLKRSVFVITVSDFSKQVIHRYYPFTKAKTKVIYNAPTLLPSSEEGDAVELLATLGLESKRYILSVGSLEPRKNLNTLIEAFFQLSDPAINLVLVGSKGNVFNYMALNTNNDSRIKLPGYVTDRELKVLYSNAACFVYPSLYEGFGLPPVEAMCNECPVIVSDIPSLKEVCAEAALFVNPHKASDLADKLNLLLANGSLQLEMIGSGVKRASQFSWQSSADKLIDLLVANSFISQKSLAKTQNANLALAEKTN